MRTRITLLLLLAVPAIRSQQPEKLKLIVSTGIDNFIKDLNDNGKAGYRLENSLNYGGEGATQS